MINMQKWNEINVLNCITKKYGDFTAIYPTRPKRDCIILNGVAKDIWDAIVDKVMYKDIIHFLLNKYKVSQEELEHDIEEFINSLEQNFLIKNNSNKPLMDYRVKGNSEDYFINDYYLKNLLPYKVFLEITYSCNLKCSHCYLGDETSEKSCMLDYDIITKFIDSYKNNNGVELIITGGEALLHPRIEDILKYATQGGLVVTLLTNGTMFNNELIRKLSNLNLYEIQISIYGNEKYHDQFVRKTGAFQNSIKALRQIKNCIGIGSAALTITNENYEQLNSISELLEADNIPLEISPIIFPTTNGSSEPLKYRMSKEQIIDRLNKDKFKVGGSICTAGVSRFRITPNGDVNPCEMLRHINLGNLYENDFNKILGSTRRKEWINTFKNLSNKKCEMCNMKRFCFNCPGIAYLETGKLDGISQYPCNLAKLQNIFSEVRGIQL